MTTTDIAVRGDAQIASLSSLVEQIRREHELVLESAASALHHARAAGQALSEARDLVERGVWVQWLLTTFDFKISAAYNYMRIAKNWDRIVEHGYAGLSDAIQGMARKGMHGRSPRPGIAKYGEDTYEQIRELSASGMSRRKVAAMLGVSDGTVTRAIDPERARQYERRNNLLARQRRKAWQKERRNQLAKKAGGDIGAAYSGVLKLAASLDSAVSNEDDAEAKSALNSALLKLYRVEDQIVKALGTHKPKA